MLDRHFAMCEAARLKAVLVLNVIALSCIANNRAASRMQILIIVSH